MKPKHKMGGTLCNHCSVVITHEHTNQVLCNVCLEKLVYDDFPTLSEHGYTWEDQKKLLKRFPFKEKEYWDRLGVNTAIIDKGKAVTFHADVLRTLILLQEDREARLEEWD